MDTKRGCLDPDNMDRYIQAKLMSFEGLLRRRKITPTDVDLFYEMDGKLFIFGESKVEGTEMKYGQKTAFINLIDTLHKGGAMAFYFHCEHNVPLGEIIKVKDCIVKEYYTASDGWINIETPTTVLQILDMYEQEYDKNISSTLLQPKEINYTYVEAARKLQKKC